MTAAVKDRREKMANQLLLRGHATMKEILTASFGEWPPRGLEISPDIPHNQKVDFRLSYNEYGGYIFWAQPTIHINARLQSFGTFMSPLGKYCLNSVMGHEGVHILQSCGTRKEHYSAPSEYIMRSLLCCDALHPQKGALRVSFNEAARRHVAERLFYYQQGIEMQARLHEVMIYCYPHWKKMPANRDELWTAMTGFGLQPPAEIARHLQARSKKSGLAVFKMAKPMETRAARGMQVVYDLLSAPAKEMFWRETLPALYADLIGMYGDQRGHKRFLPQKGNAKRAAAPLKEPGVG